MKMAELLSVSVPMYLKIYFQEPWLTFKKLASNCEATALANSVFPVPGGPNNKQPLGGVIPTLWNNSGFIRGSSMTCEKIHNTN